ncbi:putative metallopeptidase [Marinisporobacter balticus]|uniref:Putative metallopeptidase n=1 Tax=Marinisporobacter balticus TaxID=2018667 RepID=A0A4R2L0P2_9FIRM|nr:putative metallopeptidase [Marinisporobacter balticus]TCO79112.1 putative metallopeptidase [Marinisporobacter balticus]
MKKVLKVINKENGELLEDLTFDGGYNIIFTNLSDGGNLRRIRKLDNGKFGDKHWIKNYQYRPTALRLVDKFKELNHIDPYKILFIEDMEWEPGTAKNPWIAKTKLANKEMREMLGYEYILEIRNYYIERMQREQIVALLYHELLHIDKDGSLKNHDIEDWGNLVATLGKDWATTKARIKDILDEEFEVWNQLEPVAKQLNMFTGIRMVR